MVSGMSSSGRFSVPLVPDGLAVDGVTVATPCPCAAAASPVAVVGSPVDTEMEPLGALVDASPTVKGTFPAISLRSLKYGVSAVWRYLLCGGGVKGWVPASDNFASIGFFKDLPAFGCGG